MTPQPRTGATDLFRHLDKHSSWNDFGAAYWELVGTTSHPSAQETAGFLADAGPGKRVLVLGATTTELTRAARAAGAEVHVLDFAEKLLGLVADEFGESVRLHHHDLIHPAPAELHGSFDLVVADRLINRFHRSEMGTVLANMISFVGTGGQLRISVRLGLYPLDERLIARGTELGTVNSFWDDATRTIDWSRVGRELDDVAEASGGVPRDIVIAWSRRRGVESRLLATDLPVLAAEASTDHRRVRLSDALEMDVAPQSRLYVVVADDL
jgi:SAM-dependent methyltransferase